MKSIRVGYIPEHFSTPLLFAQQKGFFANQGVEVDLIQYPSGSGHLIQALTCGDLDIAVGLTEAFVRGIADKDQGAEAVYQLVGTYVKSPLNWAVSTGAQRNDLVDLKQLEGSKIGVSRVGSGSYVMSYVLALDNKFQQPFQDHVVCDTFANLRAAVNNNSVDAFLWEHFTSKKYYDNGEIKNIGNIYTPWPSWVIVKSKSLESESVRAFTTAVSEGIVYFNAHKQESLDLIVNSFDYSKEDATAWLSTVEFHVPCHTLGDRNKVIDNTLRVLKAANVLKHKDDPELIQTNLQGGIYELTPK
ncbi:HCL438Cp [Eremothecium sinecaudum]|uniref:HCL438Cp n=1 Tax=Eremothecium sinecaudum TaxID=45286 RepID=A0A109UY63_9SACH|nr:HCL438Cp [Eremothecium sinecaudum]AMD19713.1 HCL438Cp [Eremothecium sinecaudum]